MTFYDDSRIIQGKKLILSALSAQKQKITKITPPESEKKISYEALLKEMGELRGAPLWYPYLGSGLGNGSFVALLDGSVKLDAIIGIGVHILGHSHEDLVMSALDGALSNTIMQGHLQQNGENIPLLRLLKETSGKEHIFLTTSGVMAVENALKIALQHKHPANRILSFENAFSGRTLAASQISDKPKNREGLPLNVLVDFVPFFDPERPESSLENALNSIKKLIKRYPNQHAAMIFELVQGEGGCYVGNKEFFKSICRLLKEEGILIFFDEVQTFARLPKLFAFQYFELEEFADLVTIGKASQVCATLFDSSIKPKPGLLSQTFTASSTQIQAATAVISHLIRGDYYGEKGRIVQIHERIEKHLSQMAKKMPDKLSGPFGIGLMVAMTVYGGDNKKTLDLTKRLFERGVICFIGGSEPTRLRFLLPAIIQDAEIDTIAKLLEEEIEK